MFLQIIDGKGSGRAAKVNNENSLFVVGITRTIFQDAVLKGDGYNLSSGAITLTSAGESGLLYVKSDEDFPVVIKEILVIPQASTGGSGNGTARIYKNPTTGTLISNASAGTQTNRKFSVTRTLSGFVYKGDEGNTILDGSNFATSARSTFGEPIPFDAEVIVLEKGNSIAVSWQPPAGNTSQIVVVAMTLAVLKLDYNGS